MRRKITVIIVFILIILIAFAFMKFFGGMADNSEMPAPKENVRYVKVSTVEYSNLEAKVTGSGRLASQSLVDISSEVQGKILKGRFDLKKGQTFQKGDLLLRIYDEEFSLSIQASKSRFMTSIANILPDFKVDFNDSYPKWSDFFESIEIKKKLPELPSINSKKEKIFLASRNILSDYYTIKSNELRFEKYNIYAPFTGVYTQVFSEVGSVANPGARLAQIIRTDKLELEVPIDVNDIKWLKTGDEVVISNEEGSLLWNGNILRIAQYVDPTTQSISVFVKIFSKYNQPLYNGQYLKASFKGKVINSSFEIPRNSVFNYDQVYVVVDSILQKRNIVIEKMNENSVIFTGLDDGIDVVVEPLINVVENSKVSTLK